VYNTNIPSQQNQTTASVIGEITADEILDMPIVFADETSLDETKPESGNTTYFISNENNDQPITVKEEVLEPKGGDVACKSRTVIPESLKIKQVNFCVMTH